jgi:hypothetical protein
MARPFTYISSQMYYDLEIYFFRLTLFTDSDEYAALDASHRIKVDKEIMFMDSVLYMMQMFRQKPVTETPVMAWKKKSVGEYNRVIRFSSLTTAGRCLDITTSHIAEICRGNTSNISRKGWVFQYEKDYNDDEERNAEIIGRKKEAETAEFRQWLAEKTKQTIRKHE